MESWSSYININMLAGTSECDGVDRFLILSHRYVSYKLGLHRRVGNLPPPIAERFFRAIVRVERNKINLFRRIYSNRYTDANPYKILTVSPSQISRTTEEPFSKRRGWVVAGTWHENGQVFMDRPYPRAIVDHYEHGVPWNETALGDRFPDGDLLERRIKRIEATYNSIESNGYNSQNELLEEASDAAWNGLNDAMHPLLNEVAVDIGPNGELLWNMCGQHRLAIAKILNVQTIPVQVYRRHADWQTIRDRVRSNKTIPDRHHDHPDLEDVLTDGLPPNNRK